MRNFYIVVFAFLALFASAQNDSLSKKSKINQLIGIEGGYTNRYILVGSKGDAGVSYMYSYKHFLAKSKLCFTPGSNFGLLTKFFISVGYTTKINKIVSWNILAGFGITNSKKTYSLENSSTSTKYSYGSITHIAETGILINPFTPRKLLFGLNSSVYMEKMRNLNNDRDPEIRSFVINVNATILYKF